MIEAIKRLFEQCDWSSLVVGVLIAGIVLGTGLWTGIK